MFSRRHPYLFFILVFTTVVASAMLGLSLLETVSRKASDLAFGEKVGVIEIGGMIVDSRQVLEQIKKFAENDGVKAIVVRVDSPGGAITPCDEILHELRRFRDGRDDRRRKHCRFRGILYRFRGGWDCRQPRDDHRQHRGGHGVYEFRGAV